MKDILKSWQNVAQDFDDMWNFPNCIGCIDGKHVEIQAPPNSGSLYYNYKGRHSINLMAISDAKYRFTMVDIGAQGRNSDGGVFRNSIIGKYFDEQQFQIPNGERLESNGPVLPYVLLGDEAFPLSRYMMRPFPRSSNLDLRQKVFNYRLSRARRVVESAFGILVTRWRIYRKSIIASVKNARRMIKATIVLHNFIIDSEEELYSKIYYTRVSAETRNMNYELSSLEEEEAEEENNSGIEVRNAFADFFIGVGQIEFQWRKATNNDF